MDTVERGPLQSEEQKQRGRSLDSPEHSNGSFDNQHDVEKGTDVEGGKASESTTCKSFSNFLADLTVFLCAQPSAAIHTLAAATVAVQTRRRKKRRLT